MLNVIHGRAFQPNLVPQTQQNIPMQPAKKEPSKFAPKAVHPALKEHETMHALNENEIAKKRHSGAIIQEI